MFSESFQQNALKFLLLFAASILFFNLHGIGLFETTEGRYAEISREMVETGDYITPTLNYVKHFHKPPFTYWITALGLKIFGINEAGARIFLAIAGLITLYFTFLTARILFSPHHGMLSFLILTSSLLFLVFCRSLSTDIYLTASCSAALYFFCARFFAGKPYMKYFWFTCGISFLIKGPVGLMVIFFPIMIYPLFFRNSSILKKMELMPGLLIFLAVALPWFIIVIIKNKGLFEYFLIFHIYKRVATTVHNRPGPIYYFIVVFFAGMFPWSCFIPEIFFRTFRQYRINRNMLDEELKKVLFLCLCFILPFTVFSLAKSKLPAYILPLFPVAAILAAWCVDRFYFYNEFYKSYYAVISAEFILALAMTIYVSTVSDSKIVPVFGSMVILACILWFHASLSYLCLRTFDKRYLFINSVFFISLFFMTLAHAIPAVQQQFNCQKQISHAILPIMREDDEIIHYKCFINSMPFYLQKKIILAGVNRETQFNTHEDYDDFLIEDGENHLITLLNQTVNFRYFVICKQEQWEKISRIQKFNVLGTYGKYVLFWTGPDISQNLSNYVE